MVDIEYTYLVQPSYQVKPGFETIYNTFILIYIVLRVAYTPRQYPQMSKTQYLKLNFHDAKTFQLPLFLVFLLVHVGCRSACQSMTLDALVSRPPTNRTTEGRILMYVSARKLLKKQCSSISRGCFSHPSFFIVLSSSTTLPGVGFFCYGCSGLVPFLLDALCGRQLFMVACVLAWMPVRYQNHPLQRGSRELHHIQIGAANQRESNQVKFSHPGQLCSLALFCHCIRMRAQRDHWYDHYRSNRRKNSKKVV